MVNQSGGSSAAPSDRAAAGRAPRSRTDRLPPGFRPLWLTVAVDMIGFGIVVPILPLYAERYRASPATIGVLVATFSIAQFVLAPVWGRVSDRVGRKPVLIVCLAGTAVASLLTGLAGALWLLFLARAVDGASGASVSVAQAAVVDVAEPEQRARLLGLLGAAFGVGFVAGPALAGLAALIGPRVPFLFAAALAGANCLVALVRLPETHRPGGVSKVGAGAWEGGETAGVGHGLARLVGGSFLAMVAFAAFEATFALFGQRRLGFDLAAVAGVFTVVGVTIALAQTRVVAPAVEWLGEPAAARLGLVLNAGGLALLALVHSVAALIPVLALLAAGQALVVPTLSSLIAGRAALAHRGSALGIQQGASGLARVVGPALGGAAFGRLGVPAPYLIGAALVLCAVGVVGGRWGRPVSLVTSE